MDFKQKLKHMFPYLYALRLHRQWKTTIRQCEEAKGKSKKEMEQIISAAYKKNLGWEMNWDDPQRFTEKMQVEKLYHVYPLKVQLADKLLVRDWVREKIGEEYLIPLLGSWDHFSDIDFDALPDAFVLKANHGSGMNAIVTDKKKAKKRILKMQFDDWMQADYAYLASFELHYTQIKRKIVAEKYITDSSGELLDYKFLCFQGKPCFCWVDVDRFTNHTRSVYDMNWEKQPWTQKFPRSDRDIPKPENFDEMVRIAGILCQGFPHVRVDLYNVDGKIYFGEMTFTSGTGFEKTYPPEYDLELGKLWGDVGAEPRDKDEKCNE